MEDELISENSVARFYRNSMTRSAENYGSSLGLKCYVAERKDGTKREYVLAGRKGQPIKVSTNIEIILYFIDAKKRLAKR